jgi:methyl-accepting chemotaxis protein
MSAPEARRRSLSLRDARIRTKLTAITGIGVVVIVVVAVLGTVGLGSVNGKAQELSHVAAALQQFNELRDMEGDMRVNVYAAATATNAKALDDALGEIADSDKEVDSAVSGLGADLAAMNDPRAQSDLRDFSGKLQQWRAIRDQQVLPAAKTANTVAALAAISGPLADADDAYAAPLDKLAHNVQSRVAPAAHSASQTYSTSRTTAILALVLGTIALVALAFVIGRLIVRPLQRVSSVLGQLANGDLTGTADVQSRDEVGTMAHALDVAIGTLRATVSALAGSANALASSAEELSTTNDQIAAGAIQVSSQAEVVSSAAGQINANVTSAAGGAEQMGSSIQEIPRNAGEAASVTTDAVRSAEAANATMTRLHESSAEISAVVKTITSIAEQTNLLALNATIEAARAGEAGKGFAVVANEVKELAQETAQATEDIGRRVEAIQVDTANAVAAISEINSIIERISAYATTIAAAVEEQTATSSEMARSVSEAATGSGQIAESIRDVAEAVRVTTEGTEDSRAATVELARMSAELKTVVAQFQF